MEAMAYLTREQISDIVANGVKVRDEAWEVMQGVKAEAAPIRTEHRALLVALQEEKRLKKEAKSPTMSAEDEATLTTLKEQLKQRGQELEAAKAAFRETNDALTALHAKYAKPAPPPGPSAVSLRYNAASHELSGVREKEKTLLGTFRRAKELIAGLSPISQEVFSGKLIPEEQVAEVTAELERLAAGTKELKATAGRGAEPVAGKAAEDPAKS